MFTKHFKISLLLITAIILTLGISISVQSLLAAWTAPLLSPTACDTGNPGCDEPLNKGSFPQSKRGPLIINADSIASTGLVTYGKVGIGTTNPFLPLHILTTNGFGNLAIDSSGNNSSIRFYNNGSQRGYVGLINTAGALISGSAANDFAIRNDGNILFGIGAAEVMRISTSGKFGIGTTNPDGKLDIAGVGGLVVAAGENLDPNGNYDLNHLKNSGQLLMGWNRTGASGEIDFIANRANGSSGGFSFYDYSNEGVLSNLFNISGNGRVDILSKTATTYGRGIRLLAANMLPSANHAIMFSIGKEDLARNTGEIVFNYIDSGSTENSLSFGLHSVANVLNIKGTGNVGIGTTNPTAKLHIGGTAGVDGIRFPDGTLQTTASGGGSSFSQFYTATSSVSNPGINYWTNNTGGTVFIMFSGTMKPNVENIYLMYINGNQIGSGRSSTYNGYNGGSISFPVSSGATCGVSFSQGGFSGTWYLTYWK